MSSHRWPSERNDPTTSSGSSNSGANRETPAGQSTRTSPAFVAQTQPTRQPRWDSLSGTCNKGVALKRSLEERGTSGCGPEAKKMAGGQAAPGALGANPSAVTEEWSVPDKMVGLIIGRDGKQIMKLQQESQCKIQLSSESNGTSERPCTLTGSKQAVEKAKELISALITRGQEALHKGAMNGGGGQNDVTVDVSCPAHKAGLVIGRGGETIRGLQDRAGVKMVVVQESSMPPHMDKPIRITGEPAKVEFAKKLVLDLINGSAPQNGGPGGGHLERGSGSFPGGAQLGPTPVPGEPGMLQEQLIVPRQAVGVIIGKQGDTIKRIQQETGARVQFQTPVDESQPDRICMITGHQQQVVLACNHISDLISSVLRRDDENGGPSGGSGGSLGGLGGMGRGVGRGISGRGAIRGGFRGGRGGGRGGPMGMGGSHLGSPGSGIASGGSLGGLGPDQQEAQMQVAANKCGLVIGKGGESIRHIMQQSGAYIELSRANGPSATEKFFTIRGTPQSIEVAQQLISEKIGSVGNSGPPGSGGMMAGGGGSANGGTPGGYQPGYGSQTSYATQGGGQYGGAVATAPGQSAWGQPGPYQAPSAANGTAQWGQPPTAATPNGDLSKPQDNSTAWAAFYHQYYQQPAGTHPGGAPAAAAAGGSAAANPSAPPSTGPSGQPDYSQAWIDYYRQLGMFQEAELIERQTRGGAQANPAAQQPQPQPQTGAPGGPSGVAQNGAPWGAAPYAAPGAPYGGAPAAPQPYGTYGYPSA